MLKILKAPLHAVGRAYVRQVTASDAASQRFTATNERPVEYRFAFDWLNRLQPRTVLDVGTGITAFPALLRSCGFVVTAIDNVRDYWPSGMVNRHWQVEDESITRPVRKETFDVVTCISVIEHITEPLDAIRGLHRLTRPGGVVILTTPFGAEHVPDVYRIPGSYGEAGMPFICRQHAPEDLRAWLHEGFTLRHAEYWRLFDSPFWSVGTRVRPMEQTPTPAHLGCFVLTKS